MRYTRIYFLLIAAFSFTSLDGIAQLSLSGPPCVIPGVVYHYKINGLTGAVTGFKICLTGGVILDSAGTLSCTKDGAKPISSMLVKWTSVGEGSITVSSSGGNTALNIKITKPFQSGTIDASIKNQFIITKQTPSNILCSVDVGGACNPIYEYQWQQSDNIVSWTDIPHAVQKDFRPPSLLHTTYYRRKSVEKNAGTITYSDTAAVFVDESENTPN